jgi:hypothetical protein
LRLAEINSGELTASLMTYAIWESFLEERGYKKVETSQKTPEFDLHQILGKFGDVFKLN